MASFWKRNLLRPLPYVLTDRGGAYFLKRATKPLRDQLCGDVTDKFFELLLRGMDLAFLLSKDYRRNIKDFEGRYLFRTMDGLVATSATFSGGDMKVTDHAIDDWDVMVTFKDAQALNDFLLSRDQDILKSLLANDVQVEGNANYIYRYGFLVRDLGRRLGVE
jgi:hypothetical protein